ncbi:4-dihydrotrisporin dehydrogenase [Pilaira anomala]|nr:4-dihydrotrisporin dehydrogenase [Pilaira anomala]
MVKTYIVTGASRGIGLEFVEQIAANGDIVFACARNPDKSEGLQTLIDNKKVFGVKLDTTCAESIKSAAEEISSKAIEGVDILINNAGIGGTMGLNVENTPKEEYTKVFETNVAGVSEVLKAFLPILRKRGQDKVKKVLNMSSMLGSIADMETGDGLGFGSAYCVSKAALNMLTKMFANQLAKENFILYSSHPGWVKTELGGDDAPVEKKDSIAGQLAKIDSLTAEDNGCFFDFEGKPMNW